MEFFEPGTYIAQSGYKCFLPEKVNRQWRLDDPEVQTLLSEADRHLGRLDMFSNHVPNVNLFIQMHVVKEATQSSKIEGTQTNMEEALLEKEDLSPEKRDDWEEVQNYIAALRDATEQLKTLPISSRLIRSTHKRLMKGVKGEQKQPGEFRRSQNWIGGAAIKDATFIPPAHAYVNELMGDLENFIHNDKIHVPELIRTAIMHYQFETIHPFLDGNGRVGRLLIPLVLISKGILKQPVFYLSDFFEKNRMLYYDNLMNVRTKGDMAQWLRFFLVGTIETAKAGVETFDRVLKLKTDVELRLETLGVRQHNAMKIMARLYEQPVINAVQIAAIADVTMPSAYTLIKELQQQNILHELSAAKRGKKYIFREYVDIFR